MADPEPKTPWIVREVSLGNVLLLVGMLGSVLAGVWQGGMIRASLESGITAERELRGEETRALNERITQVSAAVQDVRTDVRDVRNLVLKSKGQL
jgi:hypothetical protein